MNQNYLHCPFRHCTQHIKADKPKGFTDTRTLRQHLCDVHKQSLSELDDPTLNSYDIFVCRQCEGFATRSKILLNSHQLTHVKCRTNTNYNLVTSHLYKDVKHVQNNHWKEGLLYLTNHNTPQPEFRSTLITQINFRLEKEVLRTYHAILECCVEAAKNQLMTNSVTVTPLPFGFWPLSLNGLFWAPIKTQIAP